MTKEKREDRTGGMDQQLRVNIPLIKYLNLVLRTHIGESQPPVAPAPKDPMPSSGLHRFLHSCAAPSPHIHTYLYMIFFLKNLFKRIKLCQGNRK